MANKEKHSDELSELEILGQYKTRIESALYNDHSNIKLQLREVLGLSFVRKPEYTRYVVYFYQIYFNLLVLEFDYYDLFGTVRNYFEAAVELKDSHPTTHYQHIGGLSCWLGMLLNSPFFYQKSITYCNLALGELWKQRSYTKVDYSRISWCYEHLGKMHTELQNYKEAILCYDAALFWYGMGDAGQAYVSAANVAHARIRLLQHQHEDAIQYLQKAQQGVNLVPNTHIMYCLLQAEIAQNSLKDTHLALNYYEEALRLAEKFKFQKNLSDTLLSIVQCHEQLGNSLQALAFYKRYAIVKEEHTKRFQVGYTLFLENMFTQLFLETTVGERGIPNSFESFLAQKIDHQQPEDEQNATSILNCILANLAFEQLDTAWLAKELYTSERSLHRKVVQLYNMPPKKLIQTIRLQTAKTMLETRLVDVSAVSAEVGFSSPAYFSKAFKRAYGISPYDIKQRPANS